MKYFLIETDEKNYIPYSINKNRAVDIRYANREYAYKIPNCCVVDMKTPIDVFFGNIYGTYTFGRGNGCKCNRDVCT